MAARGVDFMTAPLVDEAYAEAAGDFAMPDAMPDAIGAAMGALEGPMAVMFMDISWPRMTPAG